jgi:hypothetical protein
MAGSPRESKQALGSAMDRAGEFAILHGPCALPAVCCRQVFAHSPFAKFFESRSSALPLLPYHRPKSAAQPRFKTFQHRRRLTLPEVTESQPRKLVAVSATILGRLKPRVRRVNSRIRSLKPPPWFSLARKAKSEKLPLLRGVGRVAAVAASTSLPGEGPAQAVHSWVTLKVATIQSTENESVFAGDTSLLEYRETLTAQRMVWVATLRAIPNARCARVIRPLLTSAARSGCIASPSVTIP